MVASKVRLAQTREDLSTAVRLAERFFKESPYADGDFNPSKVYRTFKQLSRDPQTGLVALYEDKGLIVGVKTEMLFGTETLTSELCWYVAPEHRNSRIGLELIALYEFWSKEIAKADHCQMALIGDGQRLERYYQKKGYQAVEQAFVRKN